MIIELLNIALLICIWLFVALNYNQLTETIPTHFNIDGKADAYGKKIIIWSLPAIATVITGLVFIVRKFPHIYPYNTYDSRENSLQLSNQIGRFANLYSLILIAVITIHIVQIGIQKPLNLLNGYFLAFIITMPLLGVFYIYRAQKKLTHVEN